MDKKQSYTEWYRANFHNGIGINGFLDENNKPEEYAIPILRRLYLGLDRFLEAQEKKDAYQTALKDIKEGKKKIHWLWFIFPNCAISGCSPTTHYYSIANNQELEDFINHPILFKRLIEVTEAVYNNEKSVYEIFGNDAIKVRNCMKLFASASDHPIFKKMISKYCWI